MPSTRRRAIGGTSPVNLRWRGTLGGCRIPLGMRSTPADEKAYLVQVGFFGLQAIVQILNPLAHLIEQAGRL